MKEEKEIFGDNTITDTKESKNEWHHECENIFVMMIHIGWYDVLGKWTAGQQNKMCLIWWELCMLQHYSLGQVMHLLYSQWYQWNELYFIESVWLGCTPLSLIHLHR